MTTQDNSVNVMTSDDTCIYTDGGVGRLRLHRPKAINAIIGVDAGIVGGHDIH